MVGRAKKQYAELGVCIRFTFRVAQNYETLQTIVQNSIHIHKYVCMYVYNHARWQGIKKFYFTQSVFLGVLGVSVLR